MLPAQTGESFVETAVFKGDPRLRVGASTQQICPAAPSVTLVEGKSQTDGVQPGTRISPVESVPGSVCAEVGLLSQVERRLVVADDRGQSPDESGIVPADRGGEDVIAGGSGGVHVGESLHFTHYNSRAPRILAVPMPDQVRDSRKAAAKPREVASPTRSPPFSNASGNIVLASMVRMAPAAKL